MECRFKDFLEKGFRGYGVILEKLGKNKDENLQKAGEKAEAIQFGMIFPYFFELKSHWQGFYEKYSE